ncbi:MAG: helix-turn-helix transcriptional regulator [Rhodocyclaceae bacterium]|nr:helix-turn-helix transcriptional regulator [Rhodocyclaceae bacterium]
MPESGLSIIAMRLREARERAGLSQKALGIAAGIDEFSASPRINQYERAKHVPDLLTLKNLAGVLNVPVPYFYADDEQLAELLILLHSLSKTQLTRIRKFVARSAAGNAKEAM